MGFARGDGRGDGDELCCDIWLVRLCPNELRYRASVRGVFGKADRSRGVSFMATFDI